MADVLLNKSDLNLIAVALLMGFLARFFILRIDYRQYPSYPAGYATHLTLGFVASALGAVAFPAILARDYVAVTFLALAAQQFREVREMERKSLSAIDIHELIPRGEPYIEGIAKLFEARNYLAMVTALITSIVYHYLNLPLGVLGGSLMAFGLHTLMVTRQIGQIIEVRLTQIRFTGPGEKNLAIEEEVLINVGEEEALSLWKERGFGFVLEPNDADARATMAHLGQRQAVLHEIYTQIGMVYDYGYQQFTPTARLHIETGRVYLMLIPLEPDPEFIMETIRKVPILEGSAKKPLSSGAGRKAVD